MSKFEMTPARRAARRKGGRARKGLHKEKHFDAIVDALFAILARRFTKNANKATLIPRVRNRALEALAAKYAKQMNLSAKDIEKRMRVPDKTIAAEIGISVNSVRRTRKWAARS